MPLIAEAVAQGRHRVPGLEGLSALIGGEIDAAEWVARVGRAERARRGRRLREGRMIASTLDRCRDEREGQPIATGAGREGGARRAFEQLYRDHLRDVYSYAYYRVGNHHDAEDLTEQAFLQAYRHFERARRESDGRPLRPWLIRIAHNLASNYHRDRARRPQRRSTSSSRSPRRTAPSGSSRGARSCGA